jgi:hypothetical protein
MLARLADMQAHDAGCQACQRLGHRRPGAACKRKCQACGERRPVLAQRGERGGVPKRHQRRPWCSRRHGRQTSSSVATAAMRSSGAGGDMSAHDGDASWGDDAAVHPSSRAWACVAEATGGCYGCIQARRMGNGGWWSPLGFSQELQVREDR